MPTIIVECQTEVAVDVKEPLLMACALDEITQTTRRAEESLNGLLEEAVVLGEGEFLEANPCQFGLMTAFGCGGS